MRQNPIRTTGFFEKQRWNSSPLLEMISSVVDHYTPGCLTRTPQNRSLTPTQIRDVLLSAELAEELTDP
jgi:hypothetical protein